MKSMPLKFLVRPIVSIFLIGFSSFALAQDANPYDDGNNASGLAYRLATLIRAALQNGEVILLVVGLFTVASGLFLVKDAEKLQIPKKFGFLTCLIGFCLTSPRACSNIATTDVLKTDVQVVNEVLKTESGKRDGSFILPN